MTRIAGFTDNEEAAAPYAEKWAHHDAWATENSDEIADALRYNEMYMEMMEVAKKHLLSMHNSENIEKRYRDFCDYTADNVLDIVKVPDDVYGEYPVCDDVTRNKAKEML